MHRYRHLLLLCCLYNASCTKNFDRINTDPLRSKDITPGAQLSAAAYYITGGRDMAYANLYMLLPVVQYINGAWGMRIGTKYVVDDDFYLDRLWEITYSKSLKQLVDLIERHKTDSSKTNYIAAARILKVYIFSILTDAYGDIPYSEAGLGYYQQLYTPQYDRQQDIYHHFFEELNAAAALLDPAKTPLTNDIVYNGDLQKWKCLAASLRLRLGMRLSAVDEQKARTEVQAAVQMGVMQSRADNFRMIHEAFAFPDLRGNGLSQALQEAQSFRRTVGCNTFVNFLKQEQDPRLPAFFISQDEQGRDITHLTNYISIKPGLYWWDEWQDFTAADGTVIPQASKYCFINKPFCELAAPFLHMGYAEICLLLAEAISRGWITGNADSWYQQGIRTAMEQLEMYPGMPPIPQQQVNAFLHTHHLTPGNTLRQILMQQWVALFPNGYEAYALQRRTGFPVLEKITDEKSESATAGIPPRRLFYPRTEAFSNNRHYQDALDRIGGKNDWLQPVWWDK
ncbi:SusD/RagB family nutrient-binding outer membrane lipoprotein [Chitinophaga pendula]|uniref:SusD/RagB family nutrient-binding outer membrane lipoprotein n=1 Tax=Chitinophaga TaxID=79328 RepID=UPI000BAEB06F|nr:MULTISPECIES: SusD/RagB family nutrient-binding outer membrane lipoprotein [Chitinophaga]ASZ12230.1 hypothetical protein CK934_15305 [Chitinophaga sp. MD30]UCJ04738.1 SusD/RagB family nutrient-binding outer membrane lipoprotein [Chitinophaga pendula]